MVSLVSACTKLRDLEMGKNLHLFIEESSMKISGRLLNCLVDMYVKCGKIGEAQKLLGRCEIDEVDVVLWTTLVAGYVKSNEIDKARRLFDKMLERNLISWTVMISGYVQCGYYYESLKLFREMRLENLRPDEVVLLVALSACVDVGEYQLGTSVYGLIVKYGMIVEGFLINALINLYVKFEQVDEAYVIFERLPNRSVVTWNTVLDGFCRSGGFEKARAFFDEIPHKDVISWNTMINCYVKYNRLEESFELFSRMQNSNIKADKLTLISLLSSCASVGALNHGIWVHVYIKKNQISIDNMLGTALIDMYGRCGCSEVAYDLFSEMSEKTVFLWTSMIAAYAMEGHARKAIDLFLEMEETGIKPDHVTFIALLSACSHGGLVDEEYDFLSKMSSVYNIKPKIQHYGCMVDLLG